MPAAGEEDLVALFDLAYRVAYRIVGQRQVAEDIAAETVARAWDRWERISAYPRPWVGRVAANLALNEVRRMRRPMSVLALRLAPEQPDLVERLDLAVALRRLSRRQREVIILRVRGRPAVITDSSISWQATESVVITTSASGVDPDELRRIADGVVYDPGKPTELTDGELRPHGDMGMVETFYRRQLKGSTESIHLRQMFVADLAAAAATDPSQDFLPLWLGRPQDTVVVIVATGRFEADLPGTSGPSTGTAAFVFFRVEGATATEPASSLRISASLPTFLEHLPDRSPRAGCERGP